MMRRAAGNRAVGLGSGLAVIVSMQLNAGSKEEQQDQQVKDFQRFPHGIGKE